MRPQITEGSFLLIALVDIPLQSTQFMLMYNSDAALPIDVKHNLDKGESKERENREGDGDEEQPLDFDFCDAIFSLATNVRTTIGEEAADNIKAAQKKQKRDFDRRHMVDDIASLENNKRFDWKGGKFSQKQLDPYIVMNVSEKGL